MSPEAGWCLILVASWGYETCWGQMRRRIRTSLGSNFLRGCCYLSIVSKSKPVSGQRRWLPSARWPRDIWGLGTLRSTQCHPNCPSISHVTTCSPQMPQFILTLGKYCDSLKATMGDLVLLMVIKTKSLKSWAYYFFKMKPLQCMGRNQSTPLVLVVSLQLPNYWNKVSHLIPKALALTGTLSQACMVNCLNNCDTTDF